MSSAVSQTILHEKRKMLTICPSFPSPVAKGDMTTQNLSLARARLETFKKAPTPLSLAARVAPFGSVRPRASAEMVNRPLALLEYYCTPHRVVLGRLGYPRCSNQIKSLAASPQLCRA